MAGIGFRVSVQGAQAVRARVARKRAEKAVAAMLQGLLKGALLIEGRAKRRCTVDRGRLRSSITHSNLLRRGDALVVHVGTNVSYARFVEFGTGPAGRASRLTDTAREAMRELGYEHGPTGGFPPIDELRGWAQRRGILKGLEEEEADAVVFAIARSIRARGTPAQPFLFPAFEESRDGIVADVGRAVKIEVER